MAKVDKAIKESKELNEQLLKYIDNFRLHADFHIINEELEKNVLEDVDTKGNFFEKTASKVKNEIKENKTEKLNKQLVTVKTKLQNCENEVTHEQLRSLITSAFGNDEVNILKYLFSITLISTNVEYFYEERSEAIISDLLWGDSEYLEELHKSIRNTFIRITSLNISTNQKLLFGGVAGDSSVEPLLLASSILVSTSKIKADDFELPELNSVTAAALIASGLSQGTTYDGMRVSNREKMRADYKDLTFESITFILTVKVLLLAFMKNINKEEFNNYLNDTLLLSSELKADTLYYALIKRVEIPRNEDLLNAYHRFDDILFKTYTA